MFWLLVWMLKTFRTQTWTSSLHLCLSRTITHADSGFHSSVCQVAVSNRTPTRHWFSSAGRKQWRWWRQRRRSPPPPGRVARRRSHSVAHLWLPWRPPRKLKSRKKCVTGQQQQQQQQRWRRRQRLAGKLVPTCGETYARRRLPLMTHGIRSTAAAAQWPSWMPCISENMIASISVVITGCCSFYITVDGHQVRATTYRQV